jgi:hypothetical protein
MRLADELRYRQIASGPVVWETDGRKPRPDNVTYRESLHASYQGPYTRGKWLGWDGLVGNNPGMIHNDPELGFDLTMPAGQATAKGYTTRDFASAPHGFDYRPHFAEWEKDPRRHANLVMPGRTLLFHGVRMAALALGERLLGTGGCIVQDWVGLDFPSMELHGMDEERYTGGGFLWLPPSSNFGRAARLLGGLQRGRPFSRPIPGVAPLLVLFSRLKGFAIGGRLWLDPEAAHEFAIHWTADGQAIELWAERRLVTRVVQGRPALPAGVQTLGRIAFHRSGLHACCWQDNNNGGLEVAGYPGNPDEDQRFTIERLEIRETVALGPA